MFLVPGGGGTPIYGLVGVCRPEGRVFGHQKSLKPGLIVQKSTVKAGFCLKMPVKTGYFGGFV